MVKVEIVQDQDEVNNSPYASHASSRTGSSASLSSVESELGDESLYDRLTALKDIVPPSTRHSISSKVSSTASFIKKGGKIIGNVVWIVTTSALLVGLPLALSLEDEAKIVAQEKEMLAQQQGAQQVCTLNVHSTCFWYSLGFFKRCSVVVPQCILNRVQSNSPRELFPLVSNAFTCFTLTLVYTRY